MWLTVKGHQHLISAVSVLKQTSLSGTGATRVLVMLHGKTTSFGAVVIFYTYLLVIDFILFSVSSSELPRTLAMPFKALETATNKQITKLIHISRLLGQYKVHRSRCDP